MYLTAMFVTLLGVIYGYLYFAPVLQSKNVSAHNLGAWLRLRRAETKAVKTIVRE